MKYLVVAAAVLLAITGLSPAAPAHADDFALCAPLDHSPGMAGTAYRACQQTCAQHMDDYACKSAPVALPPVPPGAASQCDQGQAITNPGAYQMCLEAHRVTG
jgi:hypothetical protein